MSVCKKIIKFISKGVGPKYKEYSISSNSYRKVLISFKYKEIMCFLEKPLIETKLWKQTSKGGNTNYQ